MKTLLQLNTSLFSDQGQSSQLANQFVSAWSDNHPDGHIIVRDLARTPVPHLDGARFMAFLAAPEARTPEQQAVVNYSDTLIEELKRADVIALGLPMYNFGVPSTLKAYIDHIARSGVTFRYTENGPEGLLKGKKAYIFAARGGRYVGTPLDTQTTYVAAIFRFMGITDVEFVYAEGLNMGAESKEAALTQARQQLERIEA